MQPTLNTPFERFALAAVVVLWLLGLASAILVFPGILLHSIGAIDNWILNLLVNISQFSIYGALIFSIICAIKIERDHIKALAKAETELSDIILSDMKVLPSNWETNKTVFIVESVVVANDYLRALRWVFRKLVGGESRSLSRLYARARREATVRVLRKAKQSGTNVVWNIRYETSAVQSIFSKDNSKMVTGVEVLAYATAFNVTTG